MAAAIEKVYVSFESVCGSYIKLIFFYFSIRLNKFLLNKQTAATQGPLCLGRKQLLVIEIKSKRDRFFYYIEPCFHYSLINPERVANSYL